MNIEFNIKENKFDITGEIRKEGQLELIDSFLRTQIGAGADDSKPNEKDVYHISMKWYPENDRIEVSDDTGNKGLRDGILAYIMGKL